MARYVEDAFDLTKIFEYLELPRGDRSAILTLSGGEGDMATDASEMYDFKPTDHGPKKIQTVKNVSPPWEILVKCNKGLHCWDCLGARSRCMPRSSGIL